MLATDNSTGEEKHRLENEVGSGHDGQAKEVFVWVFVNIWAPVKDAFEPVRMPDGWIRLG